MSRLENAYAVHQCARFCNDPKLSHEKAVKCICRYLKGTQDHGLCFKANPTKDFECGMVIFEPPSQACEGVLNFQICLSQTCEETQRKTKHINNIRLGRKK